MGTDGFTSDICRIVIFSITIGLILSLCTSIKYKKIDRIIGAVLTILLAVIYMAEIVYKSVFSTYVPIYSSLKIADQAFDFMSVVLDAIIGCLPGIIFMALPIIFYFTLGRRYIKFYKLSIAKTCIIAGMVAVTYGISIVILSFNGKDDYSPYSLYYNDVSVDMSVQRLGVLTMLRLDVRNSIFGDSGELDNIRPEDFVVNYPDGYVDDIDQSDNSEDETKGQNILDIDFNALSDSSDDEIIKWIDKYYSYQSTTDKNEYTGIFEGYNVIFVTAEGLDIEAIDEERTPTLYRLTHEGFTFNNYYTPLHYGSTCGGELQLLTGLYPKGSGRNALTVMGNKSDYAPFTLGRQLEKLGYTNLAYHNHKNDLYDRSRYLTNFGYEYHYGANGLPMETDDDGKKSYRQSDLFMMENTVDNYINSENPFNVYYITMSGHMPYEDNGEIVNRLSALNMSKFEGLDYSLQTKAYLAAQYELEKAMDYLVNRLEEAGIAEKTVIVMSPDHIPYYDVNVLEELTGKDFNLPYENNLDESAIDFDVYKNCLVIWSGSIKEQVIVDKLCCAVDVLPTISNLLGLPYDSRLFTGTDILSDSSPLVIFKSRSFMTDLGTYNMDNDKFIPAEGIELSDTFIEGYVRKMKKIVKYKLDITDLIVNNDYYKTLENVLK